MCSSLRWSFMISSCNTRNIGGITMRSSFQIGRAEEIFLVGCVCVLELELERLGWEIISTPAVLSTIMYIMIIYILADTPA